MKTTLFLSRTRLFLSFILLCWPLLLQAHHSFAVHFVSDRMVTVSGTVKLFRYANPHGMLLFDVEDEAGNIIQWRAETNSPSILRRRGWDKNVLKAGDEVTVTGFPGRTQTNYMRISRVEFADGRDPLGAQASAD